jgi:hypothetical protein
MAMGARSKLVLLKLGFDMRAGYQALLSEPIPNEMRSLIYRMVGSPPDVIELGASDSYAVEAGPLLQRRLPTPSQAVTGHGGTSRKLPRP